MARMIDLVIDYGPSAKAVMNQLNADGWFLNVSTMVGFDGLVHWVVAGIKGGNLIRADGPTREEAWVCALEQARALGLLDEQRQSPGVV